MKIGDTIEFWGNEFMAVRYNGAPSNFTPDDDTDADLQCKLCAIEPNYCGKKVSKEDCHGVNAFVFVKSKYIKAMSNIQQINHV